MTNLLHIVVTSLKRLSLVVIIIILLALSLRWVLFKGPVQTPAELTLSPIIDMHVHIAGLGGGNSGCFISEEMERSFKFNYYLNAFGLTRKKLEIEGDSLVIQGLATTVEQAETIDGVVVLAMDGVINEKGELDRKNTQIYIPNDYIAEQTALYDGLYFGASINPYRKDALERLVQVKQQGATLIKWIPNIQYIDPADQTLIPFYNKMRELDLPLLSHAGQERSFVSAIDDYGDPRKLALPLSLGVTVIAGHIATTGETDSQSNYQRILTMFDRYPNLYSDISSLTQANKLGYMNQALVEPRLVDRLIYGSDFPLVNTILVSPYFFPLNLTIKQMMTITAIKNPLDRDIALKQALGVPNSIFGQSAELLKIK